MEKDINTRFDEKVQEIEKILPDLKKGVNCAELTLTNVLSVLGVDNYMFHNIAMPLAGGFGGYKSKKGWMGACGAVAGGCAAIGAIMGGKEKMNEQIMAIAYLKASKYATEFENEFGSVVCSELCGFDFSDPNGFIKYRESGTWKKKCYKFVVWAVDRVRKITRKDLKRKWQ
ncbi:MAG: C-GCAxxG-C-C family protein [Candidatus Hermodarchaeota archaeon]